MLHLFHSNRLETLSQRFCQWLADGPADPFTPEDIIVQHPGIGRWLALRTAEQLGICANLQFSQPAGFIWAMLQRLLEDLPAENAFQPARMQWLLYRHFQEKGTERPVTALDRYLASVDAVSRFDLAGELAHCFDQYLVYRPDWIVRWEREESAVPGDEWQAELWRAISGSRSGEHWAGVRLQLQRAMGNQRVNPQNLPARAALFAVSSLSPGYLEILQLLARWMEIRLFLLNPSEGHWFDLVSPAERERRELAGDSSALYLDLGNPLVASLGRQGGEFFAQLLEYDPGAGEQFEASGEGCLLHRLQDDILVLREIAECPPQPFDPADRSIQFHACHSPMREVEVLHDQLLALFTERPDLEADDVLVMTPDMDAYGPYIEAVFGEVASDRRIPYSLADRPLLTRDPIVTALLRLLDIPQSRYDVNSLLSLLETPALGRRFGILPGDLPCIIAWLEACNIRWGRDASTREALGLPATGQNSWQAGLDRMLLGYALPAGERRLFAGVLPFDDVEGSSAQLLGGLQAFLSALAELEESLRQGRSMSRWGAAVSALCGSFFQPDEDEALVLQWVRNAVGELVEETRGAGCHIPLERELFRSELNRRLERMATSEGFLAGGVTFCALTPMRSLPFRVVCLIGLSDASFPRDRRPPGFDLMGASRRSGDRSRRADDRYLFLETLVSAREVLYLSYVGQDIRDNSSLPPSVLVSELLDYLDRRFCGPAGERAAHLLLRRHPLQPFSPRYFTAGSGLFSFAETHCAGARQLLSDTAGTSGFFQGPLPTAGDDWREVTLDQLVEFIANPARFLLSRRLGIRFERGDGLLESRDPFTLEYFPRRELNRRLLDGVMSGQPQDELYRLERARGALPHGTTGAELFGRAHEEARFVAREALALPAGEPLPPVEISFSHGGMRLVGRLNGVTTFGIRGSSIEKLSDARLLGLWIRHLALNLQPSAVNEPATHWRSRDEQHRLPPCGDAARLLGELLEEYWAGLHQPLHFFPKSSRAYAAVLQRGGGVEQALGRAAAAWSSEYGGYPEGADPYYRCAFAGIEVFDAAFENLSSRLYQPLLGCLQVD